MRSLFVSASFVALALLRRVNAISETLVVANSEIAPDGFKRSATLVNGQFPGPLIAINKGDRFSLNVIDKLTDPTMRRSTSIHWHGLFQAHTNEKDGVSFVTQCPIIPNESFLYDFSAPGQTGTYWYHSHLSTQYCDGLRGPLVIYDPEDPLKYLYDVDDESTVITLSDWYHSVAPSLFPNLGNVDPLPNSTLINSKGRYLGGPPVNLTVIDVKPKTRYRFRVVSAACDPTFTFSIDGHNMTIIEVDGVEHEPLTVNQFDIFPAQRYSIVVEANQPIGNYWIRVNPSTGNANFSGGINSAILRYAGAPDEEPTTSEQTNINKLFEGDLAPLINPGAPGKPFPGGVDYALNLNVSINLTTGRHLVNNVTFIPPEVPVLLQVLSGVTDPQKLLPKGSVFPLPPNKVIEVAFPTPGFPHPMHLHGHNFDVVRVAGSSQYNYKNPPRRDVVSIGAPTDNVTIRFVTNNPGPWFLHCHIDWHLEAGLAVVFAEDVPGIAQADPPNAQWDNLCPEYYANDPDKALEKVIFD